MKKYKDGFLYSIIFYDHYIGDHVLCVCCVFGIVVKDDDDSITIKTWHNFNCDEKHNNEFITLIKSSIIESKKLPFNIIDYDKKYQKEK